ncbi:MAG: hypothetical protein JKY19_13395, partial [Alcanivoracaceae bacterium]|nr:hypothetical protein [Alcanivoracaceae bacterium]
MRYLYLKKSQLKSHQQYLIADSIYQSDIAFYELEHLLQAQYIRNINNKADTLSSFDKLIYKQTTEIGERQYSLQIYKNSQNNYRLKNKSDSYTITDAQIKAEIDDIDITLLMGPVIILNLALNSVYCLHASAFMLKDTAFIVMADSGTGKSTIARYMHKQIAGKRIADDILPLKIKDNRPIILPHFPQLKLSTQQQYQGKNINKKVVLLFARTSEDGTSIMQTDKIGSIKKLINHTVATKLFADKELKNHLDFCYQVSQQC